MKVPFLLSMFAVTLIFLVFIKPMAFDQSTQLFVPTIPPSAPTTLSIDWQTIGKLPPAQGQEQSLGVSGAFSGTIGQYIVVAGGTNFPDGHPFFDGASKRFYNEIFVLRDSGASLELISQARLPLPAGYGATVKNGPSLYFVGGYNEQGPVKSVIEFTLTEAGEPTLKILGSLPFSWSDGAAAMFDSKLYLFGGKVNGEATNQVTELVLIQDSFTTTAYTNSIPGLRQRESFPSYQDGQQLYVFGGIDGAPVNQDYAVSDTYVFDFGTKTWTPLAPVTYNEALFSVAGGAVVAINDDLLLLLGGVNRAVFNQASFALSSLQGDALKNFKAEYFARSVEEIQFSRVQLIYSRSENSWSAMNEPVPFEGGAGPIQALAIGTSVYWINGEVKPVIRTPNIYRGQLR